MGFAEATRWSVPWHHAIALIVPFLADLEIGSQVYFDRQSFVENYYAGLPALLFAAVAIFGLIKPAGMPLWVAPVMWFSLIGLSALFVRKYAIGNPIGGLGKAFAMTAVTALLLGVAFVYTPASVKKFASHKWENAVSWFEPRFDENTGGPNQQFVDSLDRDGRIVEKRGRKLDFDPDTGQPRRELTANVFAAKHFRFDPHKGEQLRKCFTDPLTGEVREVFDTDRNFDTETRAPLRLCTDEDAVQIQWQETVGVGGGETREVFVTSREYTFIPIPEGFRFDIKTPSPAEKVDVVFDRDGKLYSIQATNRQTARLSVGNVDGTKIGIRLTEREEGVVYLTISPK